MLKIWLPVILIIARYTVAGIALKLGWTEAEKKTLFDALTDPLVIGSFVTFAGIVGGGIWAWAQLRWKALTAAATPTMKTEEQVKQLSKVAAPSLSTPSDRVPVLRVPEGTSAGSVGADSDDSK